MQMHFILAGLLLALSGNAQADTYRWVDQSGKVHYGDVPAAEAAQIEQKKFGVVPKVDADLPYATRRARENFPVALYTFSTCGEPCQQARNFLHQRGIPYTEKNLSTQNEIEVFKQQSGSDTVPALSVGKTWLRNFEAGQWVDELDAAGYPRDGVGKHLGPVNE